MTGVYSEIPHSLPGPLVTAREPATTTASSGITSGSSPDALWTVWRTRSYSGVDVHGRHAGDALADKTSVTHAGAARNKADAALYRELLHRIGGFVKEGLTRRIDGHIQHGAHAESQQNALLDPTIDAPAAGS